MQKTSWSFIIKAYQEFKKLLQIYFGRLIFFKIISNFYASFNNELKLFCKNNRGFYVNEWLKSS